MLGVKIVRKKLDVNSFKNMLGAKLAQKMLEVNLLKTSYNSFGPPL
jgi:hypothetical protein